MNSIEEEVNYIYTIKTFQKHEYKTCSVFCNLLVLHDILLVGINSGDTKKEIQEITELMKSVESGFEKLKMKFDKIHTHRVEFPKRIIR